MKLAKALPLFTLLSVSAWTQVNVGEQKPETSVPFSMTTVSTFKLPWRLAFLPDGRMLITEKVGPVWLVTQQGEKIQVENIIRSMIPTMIISDSKIPNLNTVWRLPKPQVAAACEWLMRNYYLLISVPCKKR